MILVDASVWIDYLRGIATQQTRWLHAQLERRPLGLADLTLCEILQGVFDEREARLVRRRFLVFPTLSTGGAEQAARCAENYRQLRRLGVTVRKTIDCWIATFCIREGHSLLHSDRDFEPFAKHLGLRVVDP